MNWAKHSSEMGDWLHRPGWQTQGDKIIVLDMDEIGSSFCAPAIHLCSTGEVGINAAATLMRGQMGLRLFCPIKHGVVQKLTGSGIACITGNGTVIGRT